MYQDHAKYSLCITDLSSTSTITIVTTAATTSSNTTIITAAIIPSDPRKVVVYKNMDSQSKLAFLAYSQ